MIDNPSTIPKDLLLVLSARNFPLGNIISRFNWYPVGINSNKFSSKSSKANREIQISEVFEFIPTPYPGMILINPFKVLSLIIF